MIIKDGQFKRRRSSHDCVITWSRKVKCRKIKYVLWRDGFYWVICINESNVNCRKAIAAQLISARKKFSKWIIENEVVHCGGFI